MHFERSPADRNSLVAADVVRPSLARIQEPIRVTFDLDRHIFGSDQSECFRARDAVDSLDLVGSLERDGAVVLCNCRSF